MSTLRERISDALLRTGVALAADREAMARSLDAAPHDAPGYEAARSVVAMARCVDATLLWLSRRLRGRRL